MARPVSKSRDFFLLGSDASCRDGRKTDVAKAAAGLTGAAEMAGRIDEARKTAITAWYHVSLPKGSRLKTECTLGRRDLLNSYFEVWQNYGVGTIATVSLELEL